MGEWKQIEEEIIPRWGLQDHTVPTQQAAEARMLTRLPSEIFDRVRDDVDTMLYELTTLRQNQLTAEEKRHILLSFSARGKVMGMTSHDGAIQDAITTKLGLGAGEEG